MLVVLRARHSFHDAEWTRDATNYYEIMKQSALSFFYNKVKLKDIPRIIQLCIWLIYFNILPSKFIPIHSSLSRASILGNIYIF